MGRNCTVRLARDFLGETVHRMIFYGDKQTPLLDDEQAVPEELDPGESDTEKDVQIRLC